jgi:non-specific serine/threonine protein kinase/serine/threonine-protein kinase
MTEERRARVRALFDEAAELPSGERRAFLDAACPGDPDLRAEVEGLLALDPGTPDGRTEETFLKSPLLRPPEPPINPAGPAAATLPQRIGRYRILRLLGEGGMGVVYEAEQDSPRRTVALKVVRPGLASGGLLKRFRHESQILGRLHHPGIAQVYEAGVADDGQPFFAMEFIRGKTLGEYARLRALTLPARLELVARVCDAVQHAHDQGVVHRDLKPANILVDETGQPKVLDFGVARATDADLVTGAGLTQTGQLLGTPDYMSPEQVAADPAAIDQRADVYALGVILFELLAHRLPYRLSNRPLAETARIILEQDAPRLGSINPELRGDVETIVAKALEKDKARRYQSAAELAADLERFREGKQVAARPVGEIERLWRWCRRRPLIAGLLTALVLVVSLALIGMSWAYLVAESARQAEKEKRREAEQARTEEANQRTRAERARDRTRQVLDAMTSPVAGDSLTTQKHISDEQKKLLTEALTYYQEFAGEKADDEQSRYRTAGSAYRIGVIEGRLGRKAEAEAAERLACDGYAKLAADFPDVPKYRHELASSHKALGDALRDLGKLPEAEQQYRNALAICQKLTTNFPTMPTYRYSLASCQHNLILLLHLRGQVSDAEFWYRQAFPTWEKLAADFPDVPEYRSVLAGGHHNMGYLLHELGKLPEEEEQYRQALPIWEKLVAELPSVPEYRQGLADSHIHLGLLLWNLGKVPAAEVQYRQALPIQEKLAADFPVVPGYQVALGGLCCNFGLLVRGRGSGRPSDSLVWFEKAIRILTPVYKQDRRLEVARDYLRKSHQARARAYGRLSKYAEAVRDLDRAVELSTNKEQRGIRVERAAFQLNAGQVAEAVAEIAELSKTPNENADQWYDFACVYAVASGKLADKKREYADRAMVLLQQAVKAGYRNAAHMKQDSDLDSLRGRDDFKRLVAELAK